MNCGRRTLSIIFVILNTIVCENKEDRYGSHIKKGKIIWNLKPENFSALSLKEKLLAAYRPEENIFPSLTALGTAPLRDYCPSDDHARKERINRYYKDICPPGTDYNCVNVDRNGDVKLIEFCGPPRYSCDSRQGLIVVLDEDNPYGVRLEERMCPPAHWIEDCYSFQGCFPDIRVKKSLFDPNLAYCDPKAAHGFCNKDGNVYFPIEDGGDVCIEVTDPSLKACSDNLERLPDCTCVPECPGNIKRLESNNFTCDGSADTYMPPGEHATDDTTPTDQQTGIMASQHPRGTQSGVELGDQTNLKNEKQELDAETPKNNNGTPEKNGSSDDNNVLYVVVVFGGVLIALLVIGVIAALLYLIDKIKKKETVFSVNTGRNPQYVPVSGEDVSQPSGSSGTTSTDDTSVVKQKIYNKSTIVEVGELHMTTYSDNRTTSSRQSAASDDSEDQERRKEELDRHAEKLVSNIHRVGSEEKQSLSATGNKEREQVRNEAKIEKQGLKEEGERVRITTRDEMAEDALEIVKDGCVEMQAEKSSCRE